MAVNLRSGRSKTLRAGAGVSLLVAFLPLACSHDVARGTAAAPEEREDPRVERVVGTLTRAVQVTGEPAARYALGRRMHRYGVPGVSAAVADEGRIAWARGFGATRAGSPDPVTATTLFPAASISKAITATGTLRLVEQGTLPLDRDVNELLKAWKVPEN
jgi:CubicO group peptidase (beta-lactamase class C family)